MKEKHVKHLWASCILLFFYEKYDSENIIFFELIVYHHIKYVMSALHGSCNLYC